ncbi:MAG: hypothetical protein AAF845_03515 [Bacteroidota bacterium]
MFKPALTVGRLGERRFWVGIVAGVLFGASFYGASVVTGRASVIANLGDPARGAERFRLMNDASEARTGERPYPELKVASPAPPEVSRWFAPFWAGLSAALGQAIMLFVWLHRPSLTGKQLYLRPSSAAAFVWICGALFVGSLGEWDTAILGRGNYLAVAYGRETAPDPLVPMWPYGIASGALVLLLALEPWRAVQRVFRCGRWVTASVLTTLAFGGLLHVVGQAL